MDGESGRGSLEACLRCGSAGKVSRGLLREGETRRGNDGSRKWLTQLTQNLFGDLLIYYPVRKGTLLTCRAD
jgi:hypothetical protein